MQATFRSALALVLATFLVSTCSTSYAATAVTFSGLTVDSDYTSFTDPGSGVQFSNSTSLHGNFILDYVNAQASLPHITPGILLSSNGYVPGGGLSAPYDFGFTMTLPTPSTAVSMIMDYQTNGANSSVELQGFDAANHLVASETITPPAGSFKEQPISFSSGSSEFTTVTLTPTNIFDNFGAITFTPAAGTSVPLPGGLPAGLLLLAGLVVWRAGIPKTQRR